MEAHEKNITLLNVETPEGVKILIQHGANPNSMKKSGDTPLLEAIRLEKIEVMKSLMENGANPNQHIVNELMVDGIIEFGFKTPLHFAAMLIDGGLITNIEVLKILLEFGADPNAQDREGNTPLITLMEYSLQYRAKYVKALLEHRLYNSDINKHCFQVLGRAEIAIIQRTLKAFTLLLEHGADMNIKGKINLIKADEGGETLLDMATKHCDKWYCGEKLKDLLIKYEASLKKTRSL